jgi:hypothetical protein
MRLPSAAPPFARAVYSRHSVTEAPVSSVEEDIGGIEQEKVGVGWRSTTKKGFFETTKRYL